MEKALLLKAEIRKHAGSKYAAMVREKGRIPAVVYGHKKETIAISLDKHNLVEGLHHGLRLMDVQIGKKLQKMIVKDLQYDYLGKDIIHVDLMRVDVTETIKVTVLILPVIIVNTTSYYCGYIVVILRVLCCFTAATLWLHCGYSVVLLWLHCGYTAGTLLFY